MVDCDFCGSRTAVLYCRADSAKLCLSCDSHVHSANAVSRKHIRSQICDNCAAEPASCRCATDGLVLCQDCDCDAHGSCAASAAHDRSPLEGFSGVPSGFELASSWGLEIEETKTEEPYEWAGLLEELMVPNSNSFVFSDCGGESAKRKNPTCGKQKQVIMKQLLELLADGDRSTGGRIADAEESDPPRTPTSDYWRPENLDSHFEEQSEQQGNNQLNSGVGFTTLLMMQQNHHLADPKEEPNLLFNNGGAAIDNRTQIWDFNLGQLRGQEESTAVEIDYGSDFLLYDGKHHENLLKKAKRQGTTTTECFNDMIPFGGVPSSTSESNNLQRPPSLCSSEKKNKCFGDIIPFTDHQCIIPGRSDVPAMTKADIETIAKNRGTINISDMNREKRGLIPGSDFRGEEDIEAHTAWHYHGGGGRRIVPRCGRFKIFSVDLSSFKACIGCGGEEEDGSGGYRLVDK
ncbi:hypothetical protein M569_13703 [Genlisea aurea]|uniref:B box-type domain-containing protein n=1 Tax=Genlisea aurea TaxID=192259 RepID=S8DN04_9LAMI|nr:hypothetical protein M569_13703 [Genlisea aurea]